MKKTTSLRHVAGAQSHLVQRLDQAVAAEILADQLHDLPAEVVDFKLVRLRRRFVGYA